MIDLHVHTTASDGTDTPYEVVKKAAQLGISAIAITDHDTTAGISEAIDAGEKYNVEVVPGIEISADYKGIEVHILGYFIDYKSPKLQPVIDWIVTDRENRNKIIVEKLSEEGYDISLEMLKKKYPGAVIGRPHIAESLLQKGYVTSIQQAFDDFLADGKKYFVPRQYLPLKKAVSLIAEANGVAVAAHPLQYDLDDSELKKFLVTAKALGTVGMETVYSKYSYRQTQYLADIADTLKFIKTGGSDYHGGRKPEIELGTGMGDMSVPDIFLAELKSVKGEAMK